MPYLAFLAFLMAAITAYEAAVTRLDASPRLSPELALLIRARLEAQLAKLRAAR